MTGVQRQWLLFSTAVSPSSYKYYLLDCQKMEHGKAQLVLLILGFLLITVSAQNVTKVADLDPTGTCELFNQTGSSCADIIAPTTYIYVNSSVPQSQLQASATRLLGFLSIVNPPPACLNSAKNYICGTYFGRCLQLPTAATNQTGGYINDIDPGFTQGTSGKLFVKEVVCTPDCNKVNTDCGSVLPTPFNCPAQPIYDLSDAGGPSSYNATCSSPKQLNNTNSTKCEHFNPALNVRLDDGSCPFKCPRPIFTDSRWRTLEILLAVIAWTGLVGGAATLALLLLDRTRLHYPGYLIISLTASATMLSFAGTMTSWVGYGSMACHNRYTINRTGSPLCRTQAVLAVYFCHAITCWWLLLSLVMASKLLPADGSDLADQISQLGNSWGVCIGCHVYGWGFPLIWVIINAAKTTYGPFDTGAFCIILKGGFQNIEHFMIIPMLVELGIGFTCWLFFNAKLIYILRFSRGGTGVSVYKAHIRPIIFLMIVFVPLVTICILFYYIKHRLPHMLSLYLQYAAGITPSQGPIYFGAFLVLTIALWSEGILVTILYGFQKRNWTVFNERVVSSVTTSLFSGGGGKTSGKSSGDKSLEMTSRF